MTEQYNTQQRRWPGWLNSDLIIKLIGAYSILVLGLIATLTLLSDAQASQKAIIKMALGLNLIWCVTGGLLMLRFREQVKAFTQRIPFPWWLTFTLFSTVLALLEEVVTVTMTNMAPLFGSVVGEAFITASANYVHTVLFHSVIVFIPMFAIWAFLLSRFRFPASHVFLLFGLTGSLAEMSMSPTNVLGGFWFFVYGLMVYLPAYAIPGNRPAREPPWWSYPLAVALPLLAPILLLPFAPLLRWLWDIMDPVFFVESMWE